ncbi:MAG: hypothetical protein ACJ746_14420 [Bryobacteraceae bacterium]
MLKRIASSLALFAFTVAPLRAATPEKTQSQLQGLGAALSSNSFDGCSAAVYQLQANQNVAHSTGSGKNTSNFVNFFVQSFNFCTGDSSFLSGGGDAKISGSNVNKPIQVTASVTAQLSINGASPTTLTGSVDLVFTPTSQPERMRTMFFTLLGGVFQRTRSMGDVADASVIGTWVVGGTDYLPVVLAPGNDASVSVINSTDGSLTIIK